MPHSGTSCGTFDDAGSLQVVYERAGGIRQRLMHAIPHELHAAVAGGIGLFIAFIGLQKGGLIVANPVTLVTAGKFSEPRVLIVLAGIILTAVLHHRKVKGAIVLSVLVFTALDRLTDPANVRVRVAAYSVDTTTGLVSILSATARWYFNLFSHLVASLFAAVLLLGALSAVANFVNRNTHSSDGMQIPLAIPASVMIVGCVLFLAAALTRTLQMLLSARDRAR